jgi:uncharacterized membrane protein YheB (UPF0754 family)
VDSSTLNQWLPWLLPPLLGALIGYVTNYIAIRMLFRPLRAWRLFGLRLPLTPGIIPAKRGELARKMGEMVGEHLLTAEDVGQAFSKSSVRDALRLAVTDKLGRLFDRQLGPLESLIPAGFRSRFRELTELTRAKLVGLIFDYLDQPAFATALSGFIHQQSSRFLQRELGSLLSPPRQQELHRHLEQKLSAFLQSEQLAEALGHYVDHKTEQLFANQKPLRELLPPELIELLLNQLEKEIPPLVEHFGALLYDPGFRERLVSKGKAAIDAFLDSLGGLAGLLSGFMDLNKIYAKIPDFLDKAGDEVAAWLKEERTQQQMAKLLRERVESLLARSPASYVEKLSLEKANALRRFGREQAIALLQSKKTTEAALGLMETAIERLRGQTLHQLLDAGLPAGALEQSHEQLIDYVLRQVRSTRSRKVVDAILAEQAQLWLFQKNLGLLSARLPNDLRQELEVGICQMVEDLLKKEAPRLVETLNVRRMVEEKVNGLDLLQVEGLLMGIMQEQFKYINLFGALLGFLIGALNLLLLRLM